MNDNANQPAFPMYNELGNLNSEGVSKRELIAAMALQGMIAANGRKQGINESYISQYVKKSLMCADEFLKQLSSLE